MSSTSKIVVIVAAASVAVAVVLVFLGNRDAPPVAAHYSGHVVHDATEIAEEYRPLSNQLEIEQRFQAEAAAALTDLNAQEREQIVTRAAELTAIFLDGTLDEYRQALADQGLPASGWMSDEAAAQQAWSQAQENFDSSVVNLNEVKMHAPVADMYIRKDVPGLKNELIARAFNKPDGPGNVHPFSPDAVLRDVVVPLTLTTVEGTTFQADLVLGFGLRKSDGQWVLASVRINNIPAGETVHRMMI